MSEPPSGTVTFLFSDIEGSTRLLTRLRDRYVGVLALHHRVLRAAFEERGGHEVHTEGDAFFVAFARARDAVAAAVGGQRALASQRWPDGVTLRVRIGLHTGEAAVQEGDYVGLDVHRAARICAAGHGGQVLLSRSTRELVAGELPRGVSLRDLGEHWLKDLDRPEQLFQLVTSGLRADFPPPRAVSPPSGRTLERPWLRGAPTAPDGLVGRGSELAELLPILERALSGNAAVVLLGGEPGIGKSRLAEALAAHAHRHGRVIVGRCWEAGGAPPYWPWVQALREYLRESDAQALREQIGRGGADLVAILPELGELLPDLSAPRTAESEHARFRLFDSVASFLMNAASYQPLAVFLDDVHAADIPSLLLLRFVATQIAAAPILIVICYRDTEVGPDLAEALAELSREPAAHRVTLRGLDSTDISRLLELVMGEAPATDLAARVHADSQGNPLFAAEIGRLVASEGLRSDTKGTLPIPEGIRQAIGRRLQRQSERCREVLTLASVIGREFDIDAIGRVSGLQEQELFHALDDAAAARLVDGVPDGSGRLRFSHMMIRDALYQDLSPPRRVRLHRAVGEALEGLYAANPDVHLAELAHHYLQAGSSAAQKAVDYAERAGDRAASQHAYEEAARHYSSALNALETTASHDAARTCELLLSLGETLSRAGNQQRGKEALRRAAAIAQELGMSDQLARAALEYGGRFAWARASTDPGLVPLLERAIAAVGVADSLRVKLLARLAAAARDEPLRDRRVRLAEEAVQIAERSGDPAILAVALEGRFVAAEGPDGLSRGEGVALGQRLIALGEQIGDQERVFAGHDHRLHAFWILCDRAGVDVELDALSTLAEELRQPAQRWHVGTGRSMLALMEGDFGRAEQLIDETLKLGQRSESWNAAVSQRLALFVLRRAQGRLAELEDTIRRSVHEYPALVRFRCALAHLYGELRREQDCRAAFDDLLSHDLAREHVDAEWLFSISLLPEPCAFLGDRDAAAKLYSLLLPYEHLYAQAPVEAVFGSLARGLGVLATTLGRLEDAGRHLDVAIETERQMGALPWLAHAQHEQSTMLLALGDARDRQRAQALLVGVAGAYHDLGMETWASRATALARAGPPGVGWQ
jgi:eukaryotic-like serine/threonine-protein kinase